MVKVGARFNLVAPALIPALWPALASAQFSATRLSEDLSYVHAVRGGVVGGYIVGPSFADPVVWPSPGGQPTSLSPTTTDGGFLRAMGPTQQVGSWNGLAAMWSGTPSSYVNLNPTWAVGSEALAASTSQQAGWSQRPEESFASATLWSGSAASAISLAPVGSRASRVLAMTETHQGGSVSFPGQPGQGFLTHAALWSGSAASFVDLNPPSQVASGITGMFGDQQVGAAMSIIPGSVTRAAMWFGTAESFRTMHPFTTGTSIMNATCGSAQVGYMNSSQFGGGGVRAAIWFGTPESVFDLAQFLPAGYGQSIATCVEERDGLFTVGGYVRYGQVDQAFVWVGVPAPGTAMLLASAGVVALRRRRSHV